MKNQFVCCAAALVLSCCTHENKPENKVAAADTLQYKNQVKTNTYRNCMPDSLPCTFVRYYYPVFQNVESPLADSLRVLQARVFEVPLGTEQELDSARAAFIDEYAALCAGTDPVTVPWNMETSLSVIQQNARWICLEESSGGYTGGAHDFGFSQYHLLEKATGRHLHLADFFDSTSLVKLTRLGESAFCEARGIQDNQSLEEAGFTFDDNRFFLPENFCFRQEGLAFIFNSYEVAPYVLGPTEFMIPASKLVGLMKKSK